MQSTNPNGSLLEHWVLTYDTFIRILKGLGQRAGYEENLVRYEVVFGGRERSWR
jgi:hypothetical protein